MTKSEIGELSLKILAIMAFMYALASLATPVSVLAFPTSPATMRTNPHTLLTIGLFVPTVLLFLFSGFLWLSAKTLEPAAESNADEPGSASSLTPEVLQNIAFPIAGIFILVGTLPYLSNVIVQMHVYFLQVPQAMRLQFWLSLAEILIRLVLGCWLVLGSNRIRIIKTRLLDNLKPKDEIRGE